MNSNLDDDLSEYFKLIDATVNSQDSLHIQSSNFNPFSSVIRSEDLVNPYPANKKNAPVQQIFDFSNLKQRIANQDTLFQLDDSSSETNVGSHLTTLESPKQGEDNKDHLLKPINSISSLNNGATIKNSCQKMVSPFELSNKNEDFICLCSQSISERATRNLIFQVDSYQFLSELLSEMRLIGDIQNIDNHKFEFNKVIIISFFNLNSSITAMQTFKQRKGIIQSEFLSDLNESEFLDYLVNYSFLFHYSIQQQLYLEQIVTNIEELNEYKVIEYFKRFGQLLESTRLANNLSIRFLDLRSLRELNRLTDLYQKDTNQFISQHHFLYPDCKDDQFLLQLMGRLQVNQKVNTNRIFCGVPQQQLQQQQQFQCHQQFQFQQQQLLQEGINSTYRNNYANKLQQQLQVQSMIQQQQSNKISSPLNYIQSFGKNPLSFHTNTPMIARRDLQDLSNIFTQKQIQQQQQQKNSFQIQKNNLIFEQQLLSNSTYTSPFSLPDNYCNSLIQTSLPQNANENNLITPIQKAALAAQRNQFKIFEPYYLQESQLNWENSIIQQETNRKCNITLPQKKNLSSKSIENQIDLELLMNGKDTRSTIMVRNIPNRYNQEEFLKIIDFKFKGLYDFVYLPMDFQVST